MSNYVQPSLFSEVYPIIKRQSQYLYRVHPKVHGKVSTNYEIWSDQLIGASRNPVRQRNISPGLQKFINAVKKYEPRFISIRWILAEWDSIILVGDEQTLQKLTKHEQVIGFHEYIRIQSA
ncbi:MAG: hypothetical protein N2450_02475 [bacterium]|nr:hypothetical protein [bacterium]